MSKTVRPIPGNSAPRDHPYPRATCHRAMWFAVLLGAMLDCNCLCVGVQDQVVALRGFPIGANSSISLSSVRGWYATMTPNAVEFSDYFEGLFIAPSIGVNILGGVGVGGSMVFNPKAGLAGFELNSSVGLGLSKCSHVVGYSWPITVIGF